MVLGCHRLSANQFFDSQDGVAAAQIATTWYLANRIG